MRPALQQLLASPPLERFVSWDQQMSEETQKEEALHKGPCVQIRQQDKNVLVIFLFLFLNEKKGQWLGLGCSCSTYNDNQGFAICPDQAAAEPVSKKRREKAN
jgi:hypothetical protein